MNQQYKGQPTDPRHYTFARSSGLPLGYFNPPQRWRRPLQALLFALFVLALWVVS